MARVVRLLFVDRLGISSVRHVLSKYNRVVAGGEADRLVMSQDDASLTATLSAAFELASSYNAASEKVLQMLSDCLLYTSPSPRDGLLSRMPSSA